MTNASSFDPTDLQYQVDKKFAPDKEKLWQFPAEHDGWVHAHNAIRGELKMFQECCESIRKQATSSSATTLKDWQAKALQSIFDAHDHFVHSHHSNEDDILAPALAKRFHYPEKLSSDHDGLVKAMADLKRYIHNLKEGDDAESAMSNLLKQWNHYRTEMEEHMLEEEQIALPLARAYFTPKEFERIVQKLVRKESGKAMMGCFVYHMGQERMQMEFMKEQGIPFFLWHLVFRGGYKFYEQRVINKVLALKSGVEPVPRKRGLLGC